MKMCHNKVKKKHFSVKLFFIDMPLKGMLHCLHVIEGNFMIILCKILLCQSLTHITYQDSFMLLYISVVNIYLFAHTDISVSDLCGCNH